MLFSYAFVSIRAQQFLMVWITMIRRYHKIGCARMEGDEKVHPW
jgi:hypothetical protein